MKFKLASPDQNFDVDRYVSEEGKWEIGIHRVIFGRRVRFGQVGSMGVILDYCAGSDKTLAYHILTYVMGILKRVPEDTPGFILEQLFPDYHIKPIDKDPTCLPKLKELYDRAWRKGKSPDDPYPEVMPPPEWYVARVERNQERPPPTLEQMLAQMRATTPYEERFEELGNIVR